MTAANTAENRARLSAQLIFCGTLLVAVLCGAVSAGLVYREPDICIFLAMGRWIVEHGMIPQSDPFSYGYALMPNGSGYVVFQWLAELIIYSIFQAAGPTVLLVFAAALQGIAFFAIPMRLFAIGGANAVVALVVSTIVMFASFTQPGLRPETFSFLFTALLLEALAWLSLREDSQGIDYRFLAFAFTVELLWANLHCLFVFYFILIGFYAFCLIAYSIGRGQKPGSRIITATLSLFAGLLATFINPYFFKLWPFTVKLLSAPINRTMAEHKPISLENLQSVTIYPWLLLAVLAVVVFYFSLRRRIQTGTQLFFLLLIPAALYMSSQTVRTLPIDALMLGAGIAFSPLAVKAGGPVDKIGKPLAGALGALKPGWPLIVALLSGLGAYYMAWQFVPPHLPEGNAYFTPPLRSIEYIETARPSGNMLNYSEYGAVMMWRMHQPPKIFVDPRYFMYDAKLIADYRDMVLRRNDWEALLDQYKITWVFLPVHMPLTEELSAKAAWTVIYSDDVAAVIARSNTSLETPFQSPVVSK